MPSASQRTRAAVTPARRIVADEARLLRARLRASRQPVDKQVDEIAGQRRGLKIADGLALFAAEMLGGGFGEQEATAVLGRLGARIVAAEAAKRRA